MILVENSVPWVADGLRSLGSSVDRKAFQKLLIVLLEENNIVFKHVEQDSYDERFLRCVKLVKEMLGRKALKSGGRALCFVFCRLYQAEEISGVGQVVFVFRC